MHSHGDFTLPACPSADSLIHLVEHQDSHAVALGHHRRQALGELVAELTRRGRYENALIVVTADHGELLGEHDEIPHLMHLHAVARLG